MGLVDLTMTQRATEAIETTSPASSATLRFNERHRVPIQNSLTHAANRSRRHVRDINRHEEPPLQCIAKARSESNDTTTITGNSHGNGTA